MKTLPEAQRTQSIDFITSITFLTEINYIPFLLFNLFRLWNQLYPIFAVQFISAVKSHFLGVLSPAWLSRQAGTLSTLEVMLLTDWLTDWCDAYDDHYNNTTWDVDSTAGSYLRIILIDDHDDHDYHDDHDGHGGHDDHDNHIYIYIKMYFNPFYICS